MQVPEALVKPSGGVGINLLIVPYLSARRLRRTSYIRANYVFPSYPLAFSELFLSVGYLLSFLVRQLQRLPHKNVQKVPDLGHLFIAQSLYESMDFFSYGIHGTPMTHTVRRGLYTRQAVGYSVGALPSTL